MTDIIFRSTGALMVFNVETLQMDAEGQGGGSGGIAVTEVFVEESVGNIAAFSFSKVHMYASGSEIGAKSSRQN